MTTPTVTVELGFPVTGVRQTIGVAHDSITWSDVTAKVKAAAGLTCSRGQAEVGASATAGQLSITFDNSAGDFTPGKSGTWGTVTTQMPVRITATSGVTDYPVWTGFVTDWAWEVEAGAVVATLAASDVIAAAAKAALQPWMSGTVMSQSDGLVDYWPLTMVGFSSVAPLYRSTFANAMSNRAALVEDNATQKWLDSVHPVESDLSPDVGEYAAAVTSEFPATSKGPWLIATASTADREDIAVSLWVRPLSISSGAGGLLEVIARTAATSKVVVGIGHTSTGAITIEEDSVTATFGGAGTLADGTWAHIYVERDYSATGTFTVRYKVWVNGVALSKTAGGGSVSSVAPAAWQIRVGYAVGTSSTCQIGHVATWSTLDSTRAAVLCDRGTSEPSAATRMARLSSLTGITTAMATWLSADPTADTAISAQTSEGKSLLTLAQELADAEGGQLIATTEGRLHLRAAHSMVAPADPALTLSAETDVLSVDGAFGIDDTDAASQATVTQKPSDVAWTRRRSDPGLESVSRDVWTTNGHQAEAIADALVRTDPDAPKAPSLTVSMEHLTRLGYDDDLLGLDLGDMVRVTDLPSSAPAGSVDVIVESIEHSISAAGWTVTLATSTPQPGWLLGDADRGQLGETTILHL